MVAKHKTIPIFVPHRGCPCNCLFCDQKAITGQKHIMTPEKAAKIIRLSMNTIPPDTQVEIGFFGGSFTGIPKEEQEVFLSLAQEEVKKGRATGIRLSTRPDYIDDEVIERLLSFGVTTVELGAQSTDDEVLRLNQRGHSSRDTYMAAQKIKEAGLSLGLQMMLGLYGDTKEKSFKTAVDFIQMGPSCVRIYPTLVLLGTGLSSLYEKGQYTPLTLDEAVEDCAKLYTMFTKENISVIRLGLMEADKNSIVAGPWHPAFGELVMSRVYFQMICDKIQRVISPNVTLLVHPNEVSKVVGQRKENLTKLKEKFSLTSVSVLQKETVPPQNVEIIWD